MNAVDGPLHDVNWHRVRLTAPEALTNVRTVLELCAAGEIKCGAKTGRPSAASIQIIDAHLVDGDFYPGQPKTRRQRATIARNDTALWKLYLVDPQYGSFGYAAGLRRC